ncbi:hypothetical protein NSP_15220 [Nodularia spumigena CCY9414]|nr:hypothetical protein NSP_15220 [Nodularia spumigena CCY9414]
MGILVNPPRHDPLRMGFYYQVKVLSWKKYRIEQQRFAVGG